MGIVSQQYGPLIGPNSTLVRHSILRIEKIYIGTLVNIRGEAYTKYAATAKHPRFLGD